MTTIAVFGNWASMPSADTLRAALPDDRIVSVQGEELGAAAEAEAAFGGFSSERLRAVLAASPKLRWVHTFSAGVDRHVPEMAKYERVVLTNNTGAYDVPIAEHVIAMIFAAAKRVPEHLAAQSRHEWQREVPHAEVRDATLVILGMGSIGGELARLAAGVGMRVIAIRRDATRPAQGVDRVVPPERFAEVASEADYLAVTAALTPQTRGMVSADILRVLKPTAWVINIARGPIVDESALIAALTERRIGGAALDVFEREPLPGDSPLWTLDNAMLTPHVSNSSPRVRERSLALVAENVRRFKAGEPLLNVVDRTIGY
ncbi:MAG TPA: D-2-hydroxyacid dehydrogenase [Candidatus Limnocylindria bacterium]|nr:D-2-hydroxyacid dehydrogenase [Candidatus Limnocylindria bacterium]